MLENRFKHMGVVLHAELVGDGEQERVSGGDRLVVPELLDQFVGLGGGTPPDPFPQAGREWLESEQARRVGKHGARIGLGKSLALQELEEGFGMPPTEVRIILPRSQLIAEMTPAIDDLLGRTAADAEL